MHPALRWAADGDKQAHRRTRDGSAACGAPGALVPAAAGAPLCPVCYRVVVR